MWGLRSVAGIREGLRVGGDWEGLFGEVVWGFVELWRPMGA